LPEVVLISKDFSVQTATPCSCLFFNNGTFEQQKYNRLLLTGYIHYVLYEILHVIYFYVTEHKTDQKL